MDIRDDQTSIEVQARLEDCERRLAAIAELAASEVDASGTVRRDLQDAEVRLDRIYDLASRQED
jgi:hypothetical protein